MSDCYFSSSNYEQWLVYLSSYDQSIDLSSTSSSLSSSSPTIPYSTIQGIYEQFLNQYPFSSQYWMKYIHISLHYNQSYDHIYSLHCKATHSSPYSSILWYGRLSYLTNNHHSHPQSRSQIIQTIFQALDYISCSSETIELWKLIFYLIQLYGTLLQTFYCYWRCLSQSPSSSLYSPLINDTFHNYLNQVKFHINLTSNEITMDHNLTSFSPLSSIEIPFISLYYQAINLYLINYELIKQNYLQSQGYEYEKQLIRKYYDGGPIPPLELQTWHQYLSYEELSSESSSSHKGNEIFLGLQLNQYQINFLSVSLSNSTATSSSTTPAEPSSTSQSSSPWTGTLALSSLSECVDQELDCLLICYSFQQENKIIVERIKEKRRYDRVIQLYERCLLVCPSYSDIWKRYVHWTMRLGQRKPHERKKFHERALHICHRAISSMLRECLPLVTLYGQLLEEYHHNGTGNEFITALYQQKLELFHHNQNNSDSTKSNNERRYCGQGMDLELIATMVEMERRRGCHEKALIILQQASRDAESEKIRCVNTCLTLQVMKATYLSTHLSEHRQGLRDLLSYILTKKYHGDGGIEEGEIEDQWNGSNPHFQEERRTKKKSKHDKKKKKSSHYLCNSLFDYLGVYVDDSHLSLVKCCYDILMRFYDLQLYEIRREGMRKKRKHDRDNDNDNDSGSGNGNCNGQDNKEICEEKKLLHKRDQEICVLLSSALMRATYDGQISEKPIGLNDEEEKEEDENENGDNRDEDSHHEHHDKKEKSNNGDDENGSLPSSIPLSIQFNAISPSFGTSIGIRGIGVGPLSQLFSQYCSSYCTHSQYFLQSSALIETCTRHRQYQYHHNKTIR